MNIQFFREVFEIISRTDPFINTGFEDAEVIHFNQPLQFIDASSEFCNYMIELDDDEFFYVNLDESDDSVVISVFEIESDSAAKSFKYTFEGSDFKEYLKLKLKHS